MQRKILTKYPITTYIILYATMIFLSVCTAIPIPGNNYLKEFARILGLLATFSIVMMFGSYDRRNCAPGSFFTFYGKRFQFAALAVACIWATIDVGQPEAFPQPYCLELFIDTKLIRNSPAESLWFVYPLIVFSLLAPLVNIAMRHFYSRVALFLFVAAGLLFPICFSACPGGSTLRERFLSLNPYLYLAGWYLIGSSLLNDARGKHRRICMCIAAVTAFLSGFILFSPTVTICALALFIFAASSHGTLFYPKHTTSNYGVSILLSALCIHPLLLALIKRHLYISPSLHCLFAVFLATASLSVIFVVLLTKLCNRAILADKSSGNGNGGGSPPKTGKQNAENGSVMAPPPSTSENGKQGDGDNPSSPKKNLPVAIFILLIILPCLFFTLRRVVFEYNHDRSISKTIGTLMSHKNRLLDLQQSYAKISEETYQLDREVRTQMRKFFPVNENDNSLPSHDSIKALLHLFDVRLVPKSCEDLEVVEKTKEFSRLKKDPSTGSNNSIPRAKENQSEPGRDTQSLSPENSKNGDTPSVDGIILLKLITNMKLSDIPRGVDKNVDRELNEVYQKIKLEIGMEKDRLMSAIGRVKLRQLLKPVHIHLVHPREFGRKSPCSSPWRNKHEHSPAKTGCCSLPKPVAGNALEADLLDNNDCLTLNVEVFRTYLEEVKKTLKEKNGETELEDLLPQLRDWHAEIARAYCDCAPDPENRTGGYGKAPPAPVSSAAGNCQALCYVENAYCKGYAMYKNLANHADIPDPFPRVVSLRYYDLLDVIHKTGIYAKNTLRPLIDQPVFDANHLVDHCWRKAVKYDPLLYDLYKLDIYVDIVCKTLPGNLADFTKVDSFCYGLWDLESTLASIDNRLIYSYVTWPSVVNIIVPFLATLVAVGLLLSDLLSKKKD